MTATYATENIVDNDLMWLNDPQITQAMWAELLTPVHHSHSLSDKAAYLQTGSSLSPVYYNRMKLIQDISQGNEPAPDGSGMAFDGRTDGRTAYDRRDRAAYNAAR